MMPNKRHGVSNTTQAIFIQRLAHPKNRDVKVLHDKSLVGTRRSQVHHPSQGLVITLYHDCVDLGGELHQFYNGSGPN